jgi:hypothetical protein
MRRLQQVEAQVAVVKQQAEARSAQVATLQASNT